MLPSLEEILEKNLCNKDKIDYLKEILNSDFYNLYETYRESDRFKRDINEVKIHEGKRNIILYEFVANNFCIYYLYGKAHVQKDKKKDTFEEEEKEIENIEEKSNSKLSFSSSYKSLNYENKTENDNNNNE